MSTYAIGDVHGCFKELQELLSVIAFNPQNDSLWFVGDLINRGPQSVEVLRFIKGLGSSAVVVLGNHEIYTLYIQKHRHLLKNFPGLEPIFSVPDSDDLLFWIRNRPLLHYDAKLNYVMVHAGIYPLWSLEEAASCAKEVENVISGEKFSEFLDHIEGNKPDLWNESLEGFERWRFIVNAFTRMRFCDINSRLNLTCKAELGAQPKGYIPWFKVPNRKAQNEKIIFGHWAALGGKIVSAQSILSINEFQGLAPKGERYNSYGLDTGCAYGGGLTALRLGDERIFWVKNITL